MPYRPREDTAVKTDTDSGITIHVAIEDGIHAAMSRFLQTAADEHGLRIESLDARWIDVSSVSGRKALLTELVIVIRSEPRP